MTKSIADQHVRQQALDPSQSFIIQAPAGSGKTELLMQRYLTLLATAVNAPEEIVAITFTNKAAQEMRDRIIHALKKAAIDDKPQSAHSLATYRLAKKVLTQDHQYNWQLLINPNRLKIQTIDALCAHLTKRMPVLAGFGCQPAITEDPMAYYQQAATELLSYLEQDSPWTEAIACLLRHLNNDLTKVITLLTQMLMMRDQWLPHLLNQDQENLLLEMQQTLQHIIEDHLQVALPLLKKIDHQELFSLSQFAASQLSEKNDHHPLYCWQHAEDLFDVTIEHLPLWQALANLLLTKDGDFRKQITKKIGFPSQNSGTNQAEKLLFKTMKQRLTAFLQSIEDNQAFQQFLIQCRLLPPETIYHKKKQMLSALCTLLPLLAAELRLAFGKGNEVDFIEVTQGALAALGHSDEPTDLALSLDYKIKHLLVDEFQDTSLTQFQLLEKLTQTWTPDDGKSLFLVGDPMQSIYRFRQAEVGLFLKAQQEGIGDMPLTALKLTCNFRSNQSLLQWINDAFTDIFPPTNHIDSGAVSYSPSLANLPAITTPAVEFTATFNQKNHEKNTLQQANAIIQVINKTWHYHSDANIAILVRARSHLPEIIKLCQQQQIPYQAIEIDQLTSQTVIMDLFSLTKAIYHLGDRLAWLSVLRSPILGFSLADLLVIANHQQTIVSGLYHPNITDQLSADGKQRLKRLCAVLDVCLPLRQHLEMRHLVEDLWRALGGPASLHTEIELTHAQAYFHLLENFCHQHHECHFQKLEQKLTSLYAKPATKQQRYVQIMTIHKSKGLEFDTVIIPHIEKHPPVNQKPLLNWLQRTHEYRNPELLLAPIYGADQATCPLYQYIERQNQQKDHYEMLRVLYVASTRAINHLYFFGEVKIDQETHLPIDPIKNSFLQFLWPIFHKTITEQLHIKQKDEQQSPPIDNKDKTAEDQLWRLKAHWQLPEIFHPLRQALIKQHTHNTTITQLKMPNGHTKIIGTVVHTLLQQVGDIGIENWQPNIDTINSQWQAMLLNAGLHPKYLQTAITTLNKVLRHLHEDPFARWILSNAHQDKHCEYALSTHVNGKIQRYVIDRTFIDEHNTRWIIDYKTATPNTTTQENFLKLQYQQHQAQLEQYADIMALTEQRHIQLALYFPLCKLYYQWQYEAQAN